MPIATRFSRRLLLSLALLVSLWTTVANADEFLEPDQAFELSARVVDDGTVRFHWVIAPGYHLYRDRISVQADAPGAKWAPLLLPPGEDSFDPNFNKTLSIYHESLDLDLHMTEGSATIPLTLGWQGCADAGLCYPPATKQLLLALKGLGAAENKIILAATETNSPPESIQKAPIEPDSIAGTLASGSMFRTIGVFWLAGLLLAFTPCVLPMLPILSSLIAGQAEPVSRGKGFALALAYTFGMALVYAGFGVAAGLAGEGLAAALQNPWVLGAFALLLAALALSMFGFYELQIPSVWQSRASNLSNSFHGGSFVGVFFMGGVSALVIGPCVAAPLAGALVYISQTHDVLLGAAALFAMALGMGVPLLLLGVSAGSLLPRTGSWMERVKQVFGMLLLGVAIWTVYPVVPTAMSMLLWASWLLAAAALLGLFGASTAHQVRPPLAARATGAGFAALAAVLLVGAASGGKSVLQPLGHLHISQQGSFPTATAGLHFERVGSIKALDDALRQAQQNGQAVMLDFYADWCVACKEYESFTFTNPEIKKCLGNTRLLQADVTGNNTEDKALLKRFNLFGPPGIVLFTGRSPAQVTNKVIGYQAPADFRASLRTAAICA